MKYDSFKQELMVDLKRRYNTSGKKCKCKIKKLPTINRNEEGLYVNIDGSECVVLNLNELYATYGSERMRMARIAEEVEKRITEQIIRENTDGISKRVMEVMGDKEEFKKRVIYYAVNASVNESLLTLVPYRFFLDLMVIYRLVLDSDEQGVQSMVITNEQMKQMDMTEKELYELAEVNTPKILSKRICKMHENISETGGLELLSLEEQANRALGISGETKGSVPVKITCIPRVNASYNLIDIACIRLIAEKMDSDIYILPSSIQELMCVKVGGNISLERLCAIVREANGKTWIVSDDSYLSDSIYIYERKDDKVRIIANK